MTNLILCLGNELRRDDGVGWRVAEALEREPPPGAVVRRSALSGLYLLDEMDGFDQVVVVDAVCTGRHSPGTVHSLPLEEIHCGLGPSPHSIGLPSVLALARAYGTKTPRSLYIVAIEVEDLATIGLGLSPSVAPAVPIAAEAAREVVRSLSGSRSGRAGSSGAHSAPRR